MALHAVCPNCESGFTLPDEVAGKKVRCKSCQKIFTVQATEENRLDELEVAEAVEVPEVEEVEAVEAAEEVEAVEAVEVVRPLLRKKARPPVEEVEAVEEVVAAPKTRSGLQKQAPAALPVVVASGIGTAGRADPGNRNGLKGGRTGQRVAAASLDDDAPPRAANAGRGMGMLLIVGSALVGLVILVGGAIAMAFVLKGSPDSSPVASNNPPQAPTVVIMPSQGPAAGPVVVPVLPPPSSAPPVPAAGDPKSGKISLDDKERVKRATVLLQVTMSDGSKASGSGFFGCAEAPNLVLTNAHVVGMLSADSLRPQKVVVVINSGQADEDEGQAQVLGVDRSSDLAVLEVFPATKKNQPLPAPITVKTAEKLTELDDVYVFGFPLGTQLGKEITIRPTTVSSLRKKNGSLDKIQVGGGMDEGNSGGPLVDTSGGVVGVAVSGYKGRLINFAIPGERVHTILNGRISEFGTGQPYYTPEKQIGVPATVVLLDPRNLVKDVSLEVWVGDAGRPRGPSKTKPEVQPGDTEHKRFPLALSGAERKGDLILPPATEGKVYYMQPVFTNGAGQTQWVGAIPYSLNSQPVERKPADLVFKPQGAHRNLVLKETATFKLGEDDDSLVGKYVNEVAFDSVCSQNPRGFLATLQYLDAKKTNYDKQGTKGDASDFVPRPSQMMAQIGQNFKALKAIQLFDASGNLLKTDLDPTPLRTASAQTKQLLTDFHQPISESLGSVAVPMPNKHSVAPNESWKATRTFPIDTPDPAGKRQMATFNITYIYLGQRVRDNRSEAVVSIAGDLQEIDGKNVKTAATLTGTAFIDLATGETITARTHSVMDHSIKLPTRDGQLMTLTARISKETTVNYSRPK